ncbi:hypothetical protein [Lysinibacillus sp. NPDC093688]|uniref:hypothetical protein n=1 Tax=Lysinibacillus sp. NPDC093688 TaxID=3390577 RepID=UPI003CFC612D
MFFARKRSANAAAATCFVCAKAKRQQKVLDCAKAKRQQQQHDVGHSVVATGRGVLRLSSSISAGIWTSAEIVKRSTSFHTPPKITY